MTTIESKNWGAGSVRACTLAVCLLAVLGCEKHSDSVGQGAGESLGETQLHSQAFGDVVALHNRHLSQLADWRRLFSRHAIALAGLVKTFPGAEVLDEQLIVEVLTSRAGVATSVTGPEVFRPWAHRWTGSWSNGSPQYHIWDETQLWNGQWIQPVSQSEVAFVDGTNLESMLYSGDVDLGINVYAADTGITGWVSKWQHGRLELPHIGYLVDTTTLIWIMQPQDPDRLFEGDHGWFVFLEKVDSSANSTQYSIYGHPFVIEPDLRWDVEESGRHCGTYEVHDGLATTGRFWLRFSLSEGTQRRHTMSATYRFRVKGQLEDRWSEWLAGWHVHPRKDGTTVLLGSVVDQAALHGMIVRIRDLGLPLLSLYIVSEGS